MFRLPAGFVIAVAVHLAIAGWLATRDPAEPPAPRPVVSSVAVATAPPVEVELFDDPPISQARMAPVREAHARAQAAVPRAPIREPRIAVATATPRAELAPSPPTQHLATTTTRAELAPSPQSPVAVPTQYLAMRGGTHLETRGGTPDSSVPARRGGTLDLSVPARWDALDHAPAGTVAQAPQRQAPAPTPDGVAIEQETFAMDVSADGTAHLHDRANLHLPHPTKQGLVDALTGSEHSDRDALRQGDGPPTATVPAIGVTIAKFDITDFAMRLHGDDPYAAEKLRALDATRDQRVEIGAKHNHDQLAHAGWLVQENLDHLWNTIADPAARKRALFEIWDECAETGSSDLVEAGASARARVFKLIRTKLPPGSPDAFTATELDDLNRHKQSRATFAPY